MNIYRAHILPYFLNKAMKHKQFIELRQKTAPLVSGTVLEIGFGSGLNIPFYKNVNKIYALEPSTELFAISKPLIEKSGLDVQYVDGSAECIPLPNESVDFVLSTWTMCTIQNPEQALTEIYRVLKPGGSFVFMEHGLAPHRFIQICQHIGTPGSICLGGGCHLNRNIESLIKNSPLKISHIEKWYPKFRPLGYLYFGTAQK